MSEAQTINRLSLLLGERPGALQATLAASSGLAHQALPDLSLGLPSELARRRPDIREAEARLHAATASIGVAMADLYPRITLGASFGLESTGAGDFASWGSRRWSIGPSLDLPIFDMGRRRSVVVLRQLQQQEAAIAFQKTVLEAWHEVDTALNDYTGQRQRNQQLAERERESRDADELARVRYENGLTSFLDVLDAQRSLLAARQELADSTSLLAIRLVAVFKALGGGELVDAAPS
jgi:NodT family efflux transporter outer membrane factor (OMF) lipoprotein